MSQVPIDLSPPPPPPPPYARLGGDCSIDPFYVHIVAAFPRFFFKLHRN